eukprot:CAMPEP_0115189062 /NCGR_PEP_ID=MMETSP0270-20121206/11327_1 /TAXON_ID=71861 /ORGANISM="Scrippsiella trochoidea, Strain CCMP3099" /LENGTH=109 /DNA_ID=CAMNT_0002602253 /DNA_START=357 /DNA_END=686 /DNA_ORIENTATION=-
MQFEVTHEGGLHEKQRGLLLNAWRQPPPQLPAFVSTVFCRQASIPLCVATGVGIEVCGDIEDAACSGQAEEPQGQCPADYIRMLVDCGHEVRCSGAAELALAELYEGRA